MARKLGRRGFAMLAGTMVVAGPVAAACVPGPTFDEWAATDGAAEQRNVQVALEDESSCANFSSEYGIFGI